MSEKYIMLEANRLRSIDINQREHADKFKNKWTNLVSSTGIQINTGDTVNVQQVIVNTKGASDQVIEFTGDANDENFVDNKCDLKYSYYINHCGKNTFAMPSIFHRTYIGNGTITNPTISNTTGGNGTGNLGTPNGTATPVSEANAQTMLSRRSLGEYFFPPTTTDGGGNPAYVGANSVTLSGNVPNNYFSGGMIFRMRTTKTGFGIDATGGYLAGTVYTLFRKIPSSGALFNNVIPKSVETIGAGATQIVIFADVNGLAITTSYEILSSDGVTVLGEVTKVENNFRSGQIRLTLNQVTPVGVTANEDLGARYKTNPLPANFEGEETGIAIRVLTTTESSANPPNQILTFQVEECDCDFPNIVHAPYKYTDGSLVKCTLLASTLRTVSGDGTNTFQVLDPTKTTYHEFDVEAVVNQGCFMSANDRKFDGSRYFLCNQGYTGLSNNLDATNGIIAGFNPNTDGLDTNTLNANLDKRTTTTTLEIEPSFATPENIGSILTDQLHTPNKISLENPVDDFIDYRNLDYNYTAVDPLGRQLQRFAVEQGVADGDEDITYRYQDGVNFQPNNKPAIVSTPTYKPMVCNMFGRGTKNIKFTSNYPYVETTRNANQPTLAGLRRMFYESVAFKEMNRVVALKDAFYNFQFSKAEGVGQPESDGDLYVGTVKTDYANRNNMTAGDFGGQRAGELGMRCCLLNKFAESGNGMAQYPKHGLILTNMKYNFSNIQRIAKAFRKVERYLGNQNNKVDTTSEDYKKNLSVNLDIGMYNDEYSVNGHLQFAVYGDPNNPQGSPPRPYPTGAEPSAQRYRFPATDEVGTRNTLMPSTDFGGITCGGFQKDFTPNDKQQLSSIWVKSRFQEGFKYETSLNLPEGYTGDKIEGINTLFTQQSNSAPYFSGQYDLYYSENTTVAGDYRFLTLMASNHVARDPRLPFSDANGTFEQSLKIGQTVVVLAGTINGVDASGRSAVIQGMNMLVADGSAPNVTLAGEGWGNIAGGQGGAQNIIFAPVNPTDKDFFTGNWSDEFLQQRDIDYATQLARDNDLAVVPIFQPVENPVTRVSSYTSETAGNLNNFPLIAFISTYELDDMDITNFDTIDLGNVNNKWQIDVGNCPAGIQMGFDPSFTRNEAVAICNIGVGNRNPINQDNYTNLMYLGAVNPKIDFNPDLSRFELSGLNTPMALGNDLPSKLPQTLTASESPEQQVYRVNQVGSIYPARPKLKGGYLTTPQVINGFEFSPYSYVYSQFKTTQKAGSIMDSQSGIAIEGISLYDTIGSTTELSPAEYDKYRDTLLAKLGFDLDQILSPVGDEQAFFVNNFVFQDIFTYKKSYSSITKPLTTGAFISSAEMQPLSLNELNMPLFDLGVDSIVRQAEPDCTQGSITAFQLPSKLDYPYLVVYSDVGGGATNTEFIGGSDSQSMIPAVAYLYRNENNGDFFYGLESDITFTAVRDYVLTEVDIDIRRPDGKRPRLSPHSAVIFKITKPLQVPYPQVILQKTK